MKKLMLLGLCGLFAFQVDAQRLCGAQLIKNDIVAREPSNAAKLLHRAEQLKAQTNAYSNAVPFTKMKTANAVTVPVVFHLVLTTSQITQLGGITGIEQRLLSQIDVLNKDFSLTSSDTNKIPAAFKPVAVNTQIQFGLAHRKPDGSSTPGYEIITSTKSSYNYPALDLKTTSQGGADAWDVTTYLNIWVANLGGSLLGFTVPRSLLPFGFSTSELGVVINHGTFGRRTNIGQYFLSGYDLGRTLSHEIGHYFELEHTWGDDNGKCPWESGGADDGISDTPPQASESTGNPNYPKIDACSAIPPGVMFMNYMDYSNDLSLLMFTQGQSNRMNSMLVPTGAQDHSLITHPEVLQWPTDVAGIDPQTQLKIYPNPSTGIFTVNIADTHGLHNIQVVNAVGQTVYAISFTDPNITTYNIDLSGHSSGVYMVQCTFASGTITKKIVKK